MGERMRIGELARRADCSVDTIRYYEREGLLPRARRSEGNFRLYGEAAVEHLTFIRHCRSLDMNLAEVARLLQAQDHPDENCEDVIALLDTHIAQVARRIADLETLERYLSELRGCCHEGNVARDCGILKELAQVPEGTGRMTEALLLARERGDQQAAAKDHDEDGRDRQAG